ncbi:MAG: amidohydrolase [Oscillospiraceae bacterium]|jgi:5-methylthioadenosine/S-adenosylhomocysteine deaminase|nr:amidohydrolase [Oscillospiraceae bacterium]
MDILVKNVTAVVPLEEMTDVEVTDIYIKDGIIAGMGEEPDEFKADKVIDGTGKLAIPALVNAHTHGYMSLYRGYADDVTLQEWLFNNMFPLEDATTPDDGYWGALLGYAEMLKTGTGAFLDMDIFGEPSCRAAADIGIRGVFSRGLVGKDRNDEAGIKRLNVVRDCLSQFKHNNKITFAIGPHAVYTTGRDYLEYCAEVAEELSLSVHIHVSETVAEVENCKRDNGKSPVEYIAETGLFDRSCIAAHCVHLSDEDIAILSDKGVNIAHNPKSNLKLASGIAPVPKLVAAGLNVCLGTDGAASNNQLNMFSEMNFAALLHKGATLDPLALSALDVFKMATENGARALGLNSGLLEPGRKADITILDLNRTNLIPNSNNLISALCYSATGTEVETVIVGGEVVLEGGKLTKVDEEEVKAKAEEAATRIKAKL